MGQGQWLRMIVLAGVLFTGGCGTEHYNVVIRNIGSKRVDDAQVIYGEFRSAGGFLSPGIGSTHVSPNHPIPATATVEWRTEDGEMHRQEVEVKKQVPKRFRGDIQFEIADDNTVTVRVIPRGKIRY